MKVALNFESTFWDFLPTPNGNLSSYTAQLESLMQEFNVTDFPEKIIG